MMRSNYEYLNDEDFLKEMITFPIKEYFLKIILLDWDENPIKQIQAKAISCNLTIDGQSSMRRTGNISVLIDNERTNYITQADNLFSINKKMYLELGFTNDTFKYTEYKYFWFPLGLFVLTDCSISHSESGLVASLSLKDKMCLLNGQCGGVIPASVVFDNYETLNDKGEWVITRPTIYQIIRQLVNHFGKESLDRIIISDISTKVKQVVKWSASIPLYFIASEDGNARLFIDPNEAQNFIDSYNENNDVFFEAYHLPGSPFEFGQDVGYIYTDFTYPGDLIGDVGTNVAAILEQIKNTLGNYEFFYDVYGNFIFRQIKNLVNTSQSYYDNLFLKDYRKQDENGNNLFFSLPVPDYIDKKNEIKHFNYLNIPIFNFNELEIDNNIIISCNNSPQYLAIKNDFVIWGVRKDATGHEFPIRYHLAIDKKPEIGNTYKDIFEYEDPDDGIRKWHKPFPYGQYDKLPYPGAAGSFYYVEQENKVYQWNPDNYDYEQLNVKLESITTTDWRTELYLQGVETEPYGTESNYYYTELQNEWPKLFDIREGHFKQQVIENPSSIDFYLDFLDTDGLAEISVNSIGRRTKVFKQDKNVNCIFEPWIPDWVFIMKDDNDAEYESEKIESKNEKIREQCQAIGQAYLQIEEDIFNAFQIGGVLNSAHEVIKQSIQTYVNYNNNISLQTLPIYNLQPNTKIIVSDPESDTYGDFLVNSISFSIDTSGTMTINATRILEKI